MEKITINNIDYEIVNNNNAIDLEQLELKITEYFNNYDYIFGDWAYGKLRLKGFNDKKNKNFKKINDIASLDDYIQNFCAYGCKWFLIKRIRENN